MALAQADGRLRDPDAGAHRDIRAHGDIETDGDRQGERADAQAQTSVVADGDA
ncbi:MAG: hypothetical protein ACLGIA_09675 [Actinomycetes bacterium]